jgi:hypothetical protein
MKLRPLIVSVLSLTAFLAIASRPIGASEIVYDGFGQSFPAYANDGVGFSGPWAQGGFNAFASGYIQNPYSLSYPSLVAGSGGSVSGDAFAAINGAIRDLAQPVGADGTTVYLSFLVQPNGVLSQGLFNGLE